jgi:hypothetical protein
MNTRELSVSNTLTELAIIPSLFFWLSEHKENPILAGGNKELQREIYKLEQIYKFKFDRL